MTLKLRAAAALAVIGWAAMASPAAAQYYPYPPQRDYYGPRDYYEPRGPRRWDDGGGYYRPRPRPVFYGNLCVTSRGNCRSQTLPAESPCSCFIPGFGPKRGAIVARPGY
jgi:hypothetical protein